MFSPGAPAFASRGTGAFMPRAVGSPELPLSESLPQVVGRPVMLNDSLTVIGTPCSGPQTSPRANAASAPRARSRATSICHATTALSAVLWRSARARKWSRSSRQPTRRSRPSAASRVAEEMPARPCRLPPAAVRNCTLPTATRPRHHRNRRSSANRPPVGRRSSGLRRPRD